MITGGCEWCQSHFVGEDYDWKMGFILIYKQKENKKEKEYSQGWYIRLIQAL
jgi:hypothetical protein